MLFLLPHDGINFCLVFLFASPLSMADKTTVQAHCTHIVASDMNVFLEKIMTTMAITDIEDGMS